MNSVQGALSQRESIIKDLGFRASGLESLARYLDLLWSSNEELNLISRKMTPGELVDNHVVDCLLPLAHFPKNISRASDFGSGGGLPGVLFAIQFFEVEYTLHEKSPKKREFLQKCAKLASNIRLAEDVPRQLPKTDVVTARAFKPLDVILDMSREYYLGGGKYFLLKGRREKIDEEFSDARKKFKNLKIEVLALKSPLLEVERHLVLI